ncbi:MULTISPECIES: hypothetical protein [Mesorhizobium]|uniref:Uncharacterized protein n=1 Tax=Rhizobium loti TaxID=381 RepID=A0A1A5K0I4_RHILI|nr:MULTISPECIES: hypothetical protein [Mesorhizobium]OBP79989.1 hypothetical protein BAE39_27095 [Mesorhizobium loti]OBP85538.1 hypothetical protein BAE41_26770 [Mesorhizobium loti]OBP96887.1 hypothetical protein BAE38_26695 [Mesorhizobium loti]OBQ59049.1 hypothetical protein A8145_25720 [Mesorhizobium loti]OBQ73464.1 hypothetical protein A9K72_30595 [Mesorhizobium loti]
MDAEDKAHAQREVFYRNAIGGALERTLQLLPAGSTHVIRGDYSFHCLALSTGMLLSDRVAGFGERDVQQITEKFQPMRGRQLAHLVESADDDAKGFNASFCTLLVRRSRLRR